jgi:hypothetical protein
MHQMPEHVCRWNLAPGQDQRSRVTPGYDRGPRTHRDESRLCRGPVRPPDPPPSPTVATDIRRRERPWHPQFYGSWTGGARGSSGRYACRCAQMHLARGRIGRVVPRQLRSQLRQLRRGCCRTAASAGRLTHRDTARALPTLGRERPHHQHLSRELNATGDGGGSTSTVTPCRASPSILESD